MVVRFHEELLSDSVDEAADLFVRRYQRLDPPDAGLHHVLEHDARLEAHLDVLFYGGRAAVALCADAAQTSPGAIYAGTRTAVRLGRLEDWHRFAERAAALPADPDRLAQGEPSALQALASGGAHEAWGGDMAAVSATVQAGGDGALAEALAYAAGYHRWAIGPALAAGLCAGVKTPQVWLWALGQVDEPAGRATLVRFLENADPAVAHAAALGLCRTEDDQVAAWLAAQANNQLWAPVVLALLGGTNAAAVLAQHMATGDAFAVMAAGLLGDAALTPHLLDACNDPQLAAMAAQALHLLTGLAPLEQTREAADGAEAAHDEEATIAWRLCQSRSGWTEALARARLPLSAGMRTRGGQAAMPIHTVSALRSPHLRHAVRALLIDELFIRYGLGVHLRADQHASRQLRVLDKLEQFLPHMAPAARPNPGAFTFQGRQAVGF